MLDVAPSYGYAPRGQRAVISQPSRRTVSYMLTLCVCPVGILYWTLRSGSIDRRRNILPGPLEVARRHHASARPGDEVLTRKGLPTVAEIAELKSISLKYIPAYAPHLNPVMFTINSMRNLLKRKEAWTVAKLGNALEELFISESFSKESMTKLFKIVNVIFGGPHPGQRLKV